MLTRRTNILFDQELWKILAARSRAEKTSVGALVRQAVIKVYSDTSRAERRKEAIDRILSNRVKQRGRINYKEYVNYGRKY